MKIYGEIVTYDGINIYIPWFHRVAPSLMSGTKVFGVLINGKPSELILSPYHTDSWTDLWQIDCDFHDKPGLFAKLTHLLGNRFVNVNILAHENYTNHLSKTFHVRLICDMKGYGDKGNPDSTSGNRVDSINPNLDFLKDYLTVEMFKDIVHNKKQGIRIKRLKDLHKYGLIARNSLFKNTFSGIISKGRLEIKTLNKQLESDFLEATQRGNQRFEINIISDTEERFVSISSLPKERDYLLIAIRHTDAVGQIARYTDLLRNSFSESLNIHCSYLSLIKADELAEWRCLFDVPNGMKSSYKQKIRELLNEKNNKWRDENLQIKFPLPINYKSEPWEKENL